MSTEPAQLLEALQYKAPFLSEKLLKDQIVASAAEADELCTELVRYLVLGRMYPDKLWYMVSSLVDEAWHQFVLFSERYHAFCMRYFGQYIHHAPGMSPDASSVSVSSSFEDFSAHYARHFGAPPSRVWDDTSWVALTRRVVINTSFLPVSLERDESTGMITVLSRFGALVRVSELAREALEFIWRTRAFYVRELPGELTDDEKVGVATILVGRGALLLGP